MPASPTIVEAPLSPSATAQLVIDQALQLIAIDARRLEDRLRPSAQPNPSLEQLRAGPLGQDLRRLALVAEGRTHESHDQIRTAIESVLRVALLACRSRPVHSAALILGNGSRPHAGPRQVPNLRGIRPGRHRGRC